MFGKHPFSIKAILEKTVVLTYAVPLDELMRLLPPQLVPDTHDEKWAFIAVAAVRTRSLRPFFLPSWSGAGYTLIGYRVFVKYKDSNGKRLRGLYILKSQTDSLAMKVLGNLITHYNYSKIDIIFSSDTMTSDIRSEKGGLHIQIKTGNADSPLPVDSPFLSWKEARRFCGPLPFTFYPTGAGNKMMIVEGLRKNWLPLPVEVTSQSVLFLESLNLRGIRLACAFEINEIPYYWKKGRTEICYS